MLTGYFEDAGTRTPGELRTAYEQLVIDAIDGIDPVTAAAEAGVDAETVEALLAGEGPDLEVESAAALLALSAEYPDAHAIAAEARDVLLMGMTTAVLDVDRLASELEGDMEPKLIQQKIEGRHPMTLTEYARLHHAIEASK